MQFDGIRMQSDRFFHKRQEDHFSGQLQKAYLIFNFPNI